MKLDFLTPGDWRDSYESRLTNDNGTIDSSGGYEVNSLSQILTVVGEFIRTAHGQTIIDLFKSFCVYIDGDLFGEYRECDNKFHVFPPMKLVEIDGKLAAYYPFGSQDKLFSVC